MLTNLRNALMAGKRLPYDAEVEYLAATGAQWIDSGIDAWGNIEFEVLVDFSEYYPTSSGAYEICGAYVGTGGKMVYAAANNRSTKRYIGGRDGSTFKGFNVDTFQGRVDLIRVLKTGAYINDSVWRSGATSNVNENGYTFRIFRVAGFSPTQGLVGAIRSCKIWKDGSTLVRDFIPVRVGTVGYLYDRVSGKLFGNDGTGDFVLGPDVVPVEYIESHGTEWIDTGLLGRDGYDFEYRFRPMNPLPCSIGGEYEPHRNCYIGLVRSNGYLAYNYYSPNDIVEVQSLTLGTDYNVKAHLYSGEQYFEVNGVRGGIGGRAGAFTSSYNIYLFAINSNNQPSNLGAMRLYNLTAHLNTIPTRSFLPARVGTEATSWEGAMMDVLTRRIYRNAGTGAFTYGNDLKYPIPSE